MTDSIRNGFLALVLVQAAHSIEEYAFRLYEIFGPARFASSLVSGDLAFGFIVLNASFFVFGVWGYFALVRPNRPAARSFLWGWVLVELANGFGHSVIAVARGGYFPGLGTAPVLFVIAAYLATQLSRQAPRNAAG